MKGPARPTTRRGSTRGLGSARGVPRRETRRGLTARDLGLVAAGAVVAAAALLGAWALITGQLGLGGPGATPSPSGPSALPAGTYRSQAFQPQLTFTLPDGWWIESDSAPYLSLQPVESNLIGIHLFRDPQAASQEAACPLTAEPDVGRLSSDLSTWIRGRPGLATSNPRLSTIGGLRGVELDIRIADGWSASCPFANGLPTVPLFVIPDAGLRWVIVGTERLRLALLDVPGGGTVVVDVDAFDGALMDDLVARAAPIVGTFSFATP
jgi:hypothetical protein